MPSRLFISVFFTQKGSISLFFSDSDPLPCISIIKVARSSPLQPLKLQVRFVEVFVRAAGSAAAGAGTGTRAGTGAGTVSAGTVMRRRTV